jgi:hypothetical protein
MAEPARRPAGHVRRVDHTGVNLPACATSPEQWQNLVGALAPASTMSRHPTGPSDWETGEWLVTAGGRMR